MKNNVEFPNHLKCRLQFQHLALTGTVKQLPHDKTDRQIETGKWSIRENIAHLVRYQFVFSERITSILQTHEPQFGRYKAEEDPGFEEWRVKSVVILIPQLVAQRENINIQIANLSKEQLERKGYHPKYGWLSIYQWMEFFLLHEAHHLFTIFKLANNDGNGE